MNYIELNSLWEKQRNQYQEWEVKLIKSAHDLREKVEELLNLPKLEWEVPTRKGKHKYVELVSVYPQVEPEKMDPTADSINENGELIFAIGVTFEKAPNSFPKESLHVSIAIRFSENELQYSLFNLETLEADNNWLSNDEKFCKRILGRYAELLSHDPHSGLAKKRPIGFIHSS